MGGENSKLNYRKSVIQLTTKTEPVDPNDNEFWDQFWLDYETTVQDIFILMPAAEIRALREESPTNLSTLCSKAVMKIVQLSEAPCLTSKEQNTVLNCIRVLTRIMPYLFEDSEWMNFFWTTKLSKKDIDKNLSKKKQSIDESQNVNNEDDDEDNDDVDDNNYDIQQPLAEHLISSLYTLLFYPDFTVYAIKKPGPDNADDHRFLDSCEYIWENGVGFSGSPGSTGSHDANRTEILKLLLACCSATMYLVPEQAHVQQPGPWVSSLTSRRQHRHALPLFTSLLNIIFSYDPVGYGMPYNHLMFSDYREPLVEVALQLLCVSLESNPDQRHDIPSISNRPKLSSTPSTNTPRHSTSSTIDTTTNHPTESIDGPDNLFVNFMSRIHKDDDFEFLLMGFVRLLNNPLTPTYLPRSLKKIQFHQELLILLWRCCEINREFMFHLLKSEILMDILVPILYHMNNAAADPARLGVMHIGAFLLLLFSGERNFGVKLNKAYTQRVHIDVPVFTGNHADLLILVFHRIITTGHSGLQPLYDCFLTVIVNISPYLKTLATSTSSKLMHLVEAFSSPWFLFSSPSNHHLIFFLLETLNNIIQYQFDGNSNLVYCMIRKRQVFHMLSGLPIDPGSIGHALSKKSRRLAKMTVLSSTNTSTIPGVSTVSSASTHHHHHHASLIPNSRIPSNNNAATDTAGQHYTPQTPSSPSSQRSSTTTSSAINSSDPEPTSQFKATLEETPALQVVINKARDSSSTNSKTNGTPSIESTVTKDVINQNHGSGSSTRSSVTTPITTNTMSDDESTIEEWLPTTEWAQTWKQKLPLQTIMRLLQVLVPQVEKICIDKGLTDESEIIKFLQRGTLVGLLPVPHPLLIRKYQSNPGTDKWFRTYMWGVIYLRNEDPPIWYDTNIQLFEIQRVAGNMSANN